MNTESKNILFTYNRLNVLGGIETRWIDEFYFLKQNNFKVHLAIPKDTFKSDIGNLVNPDEIILLESDKIKVAINFVSLVNELVQIIYKHKISLISLHMQGLFELAVIMAAQLTKTPIISTIHGTPDIYRRPLDRLLIQQFGAKSYSLLISVSEAFTHITPPIEVRKCVIPNLVNFDKFKSSESKTDNGRWLLVSRISPEKYPSILKFISTAHSCKLSIDIAGTGNTSEIKKRISSKYSDVKINFLGEVENVSDLMPLYSGVAGMGRVAIEGIACMKPVCVLNLEGHLLGLVTVENLDTLIKFNFTGKGLIPIYDKIFSQQLESYSKDISRQLYSSAMMKLSRQNWNNYIELYSNLEFRENNGLEALYHKLSYFAINLNKPFIDDDFFKQLFYETLIEHNLSKIIDLWNYYENSIGLLSNYPKPFDSQNSKKLKWWS